MRVDHVGEDAPSLYTVIRRHDLRVDGQVAVHHIRSSRRGDHAGSEAAAGVWARDEGGVFRCGGGGG